MHADRRIEKSVRLVALESFPQSLKLREQDHTFPQRKRLKSPTTSLGQTISFLSSIDSFLWLLPQQLWRLHARPHLISGFTYHHTTKRANAGMSNKASLCTDRLLLSFFVRTSAAFFCQLSGTLDFSYFSQIRYDHLRTIRSLVFGFITQSFSKFLSFLNIH